MVFIILRGSLILLRRLLTSLLILSLMLQQGLPAFAHSPSFLSLTKIDEITSDKITGALDATMSVDNRVFTGAGWASIASDVTNFWGNLAKAGEGAKNGMVNLGVAVGAVIGSLGGSGEGDEHVGPVDTAGKRIATMQTSNELMNTSKEFVLLASGEPLTKDQRQQLAKDLQATAAK